MINEDYFASIDSKTMKLIQSGSIAFVTKGLNQPLGMIHMVNSEESNSLVLEATDAVCLSKFTFSYNEIMGDYNYLVPVSLFQKLDKEERLMLFYIGKEKVNVERGIVAGTKKYEEVLINKFASIICDENGNQKKQTYKEAISCEGKYPTTEFLFAEFVRCKYTWNICVKDAINMFSRAKHCSDSDKNFSGFLNTEENTLDLYLKSVYNGYFKAEFEGKIGKGYEGSYEISPSINMVRFMEMLKFCKEVGKNWINIGIVNDKTGSPFNLECIETNGIKYNFVMGQVF
jgi:hypothetical protein